MNTARYRSLTLASAMILALVAGSSSTAAQDASKQSGDERAAWISELHRLSNEAPSEYLETQRTFTFAAELLLARLGYGTSPLDGVLDDATRSAVRRYEGARGLAETGDPLTFETMRKMSEDSTLLDAQPLGLPPRRIYLDFWKRGYAGADGTWIILGEDQVWPEQTSKISCDRTAGTCVEAIATVVRGVGDRLLSVDLDTYEIERWDDHEIVTKPLQFGCTRHVRRISRTQKSVTGIRSTVSTDEACKELDRDDKFLVLSDGAEVAGKLQRQYREKWLNLMRVSPGLRVWLERGAGR